MSASTQLFAVISAVLFVIWVVAAFKLRHEARRKDVFKIWRYVLVLLVVFTTLVVLILLVQYVVVGEYWVG